MRCLRLLCGKAMSDNLLLAIFENLEEDYPCQYYFLNFPDILKFDPNKAKPDSQINILFSRCKFEIMQL